MRGHEKKTNNTQMIKGNWQSRFQTEMRTVAEMVKRIVAENKAAPMDQEEYQRRRNELAARYEAARDGYEKASREISDRQGKRKTYMRFIGGLQRLDGFCGKFNEEQNPYTNTETGKN